MEQRALKCKQLFEYQHLLLLKRHLVVKECGWPWFIFCRYQLMAVANRLLLTGNQFVTTFLVLGIIVNHKW